MSEPDVIEPNSDTTVATSRRQPSSNDVARLASVSNATVSYVFNGRRDGSSVSEEVRLRVVKAAHTLGYQPNRTARALKTGRTNLIALWTASLSGIYPSLIRQFEPVIDADGYEMLVTGSPRPEPINLNRWPVDGIIALDKLSVLKDIHWRTAYHPPMVSVGTYYTTAVDHVGIDLYAGVEQALTHLAATGRQRIALVTIEGNTSYSQSLLDRFVPSGQTVSARTFLDLGIDPRFAALKDYCHRTGKDAVIWAFPGDDRTVLRHEVRSRLEKISPEERPDALLCHNDFMAMGVVAGVRDAGLTVPDEIAVVGCDGSEEAELCDLPLSTIVQPSREMARYAWGFLRRRLQDPTLDLQSVILTPQFVERSSSVCSIPIK